MPETRPTAMRLLPFWAASLPPLLLLGIGCVAGGGWLAAALVWVTGLALLLDTLIPPPAASSASDDGGGDGSGLAAVLGLATLALLPLVVWAVAGPGALGAGERALAFLAGGLVAGQVGLPVAHELIHRGDRRLSRLGTVILTALLFGHHASAHRLVHHVHVATGRDPNTARRGESLYRFLPRAWIGSFQAGLQAEAGRNRHGWHPYTGYLAGAAAGLAVAFVLAGPGGLAVWTALGLWASAQLLVSDYVQHYGLVRATGPDGRPEPVGPAHAWNAPHGFSAALMLNAPRHADHHAHPGRPFPALRLPERAPMLPAPLPAMAAAALVPPLWRRLMDPRLDRLAPEARGGAESALGRRAVDLSCSADAARLRPLPVLPRHAARRG